MSKSKFSVAAALLCAFFAGSLHAATITVTYVGTGLSPPNGNYEIDCSGNCQGLFSASAPTVSSGAGSWADTTASGFNVSPSNESAELAALNTLLGLSGGSAISGVDKTDGDGSTFTTNREYFAIKQGTGTIFFKNTSGGSLTIVFKNADGSSAQYSHYTEFGSVVPIPAAAWLFGSALLGIAGLGYRRKLNTQAA